VIRELSEHNQILAEYSARENVILSKPSAETKPVADVVNA
jgi:hypothetical protein